MSNNQTKLRSPRWLVLLALLIPSLVVAQSGDSLLQQASLEQVIQYALAHQPLVKQAEVDEEITEKLIKGRLADWYPQVNFTYNYQHFIDLQTSVIGGNVIRFGVNNTSSAQLTATQSIFNRDALLASRTASKVRLQANQNTAKTRIDVVANVSKAFYDLLATLQQIRVSEESIVRLQQSLRDAQSRYKAGVTDKTDYKRATIQLGNARAALTSNRELLKSKQENLRLLMGYPRGADLPIAYDTVRMEEEVTFDTTQVLNYSQHIDYRLLYTQRELQQANVNYSQWAFVPSLNAFGAYILNYQNNNFGELYETKYPFSYVGATLTFPVFQGGKRLLKIQEQKWARKRIDLGLENLQNALSAEYTRALAQYKSNLELYLTQKENVALAREVYDVIQLQYKNGVKTYLEVTIAESDLRTTRINYFNSLYQVLASKLDVQRALGQINY